MSPAEKAKTNSLLTLDQVESWTGKFAARSETADDASEGVAFRKGDVLFSKLRPYLAKSIRPKRDGVASTEFLVLRPTDHQIDARFLHYYTLSEPFVAWAVATSYGTKMPRSNWDSIGRFEVLTPRLEVQRRIADMLDTETARIDTLIEKNERVLALLERRRLSAVVDVVCGDRAGMSASRHASAFWLGALPTDWITTALGFRYDVQLGKMLNSERRQNGDQRPYLANVDVQWGRFDVTNLRTMDLSDEEWPRYGVEPGDVLICEGGDIGRSAVWPDDGPSGIYFQKALHRARPRDAKADNPQWLFYAMFAAAKTGVFQFGADASTIDHLTGERLREHRFPFPPKAEQDRLVGELDRIFEKTDSLREKVIRQQELLRLRRQALITAAVTGQIEV